MSLPAGVMDELELRSNLLGKCQLIFTPQKSNYRSLVCLLNFDSPTDILTFPVSSLLKNEKYLSEENESLYCLCQPFSVL
jgi:hypothetical protein